MDTCSATGFEVSNYAFISVAVTVIVLLLIMLVGLLHLRFGDGGTFGLAQPLWKQV